MRPKENISNVYLLFINTIYSEWSGEKTIGGGVPASIDKYLLLIVCYYTIR